MRTLDKIGVHTFYRPKNWGGCYADGALDHNQTARLTPVRRIHGTSREGQASPCASTPPPRRSD